MRSNFTIFMMVLALIIVLFLSVPLIKLFVGVGTEKFFETLQDKEVLDAIWLTMRVAFYATVFVFFTGIPLAYLIARHDFLGKSLLETMIDIPVMVPHTAAGIALLTVFGSASVGETLSSVGLDFIDGQTGIMAAMMFLSAPFLINSAKDGFRKVDSKLEKVARTLGASAYGAFFKIAIPNARKDIVNGALMMWSRGLGEFGAVVILAYHPMTAPVLIYDRFTSYGLVESAPVAATMIAVSIVVFLVIRTINNRLK